MRGHGQSPVRSLAARDDRALTQSIEDRTVVAVESDLEMHDLLGADRPFQSGWCVQRDDPAVVDDRHAVAELIGLLHVMRGEEHRPSGGLELADAVA